MLLELVAPGLFELATKRGAKARSVDRRSAMKGVSLLAAVAACTPARPAEHPIKRALPAPGVVLAIANETDLRLVEVTPATTRELRTATLNERVDSLAWLGDDPIVLLQRSDVIGGCGLGGDAAVEAECNAPPTADEGTIGRLTKDGFIAYPRLPESTWDAIAKRPSEDSDPCVRGCWSMHVRGTEVWQGHCKWTFSADGRNICQTELYARIDKPGPAQEKYPKDTSGPDPDLPTITPAANVSVTFEHVTPPPQWEGDEPEARWQMHCAIDGKELLVYPPLDQLDLGMSNPPTWLSTQPPRYMLEHLHDGFAPYGDLMIFEGCARTDYTRVIAGPGGLVALTNGASLEILRHGVHVGSTLAGEHISFAPPH